MAVFENCCVLLEVRTLSFKEKKKLKSAITENGGTILFVVNKWCSLIVTSDVSSLSSNRLRSIQKYQTPVVGLDYVYNCLDRGALLPFDNYLLDTSPPAFSATSPYHFSEKPDSPRHQASVSTADVVMSTDQAKPVDPAFPAHWLETPQKWQVILDKFRFYTETDSDLPSYPDKFHVAKYSIFVKGNSTTWFVLELQSVRGENGQQYRVVRYWKNDINAKKEAVKDLLVFPSTSEEAVEVYEALRDVLLVNGLQRAYSVPSQAQDLGSFPLQQLLLEEKLNTGCLSDEVGVFVELLWTEALGHLGKILRVPIDKLSLNDVSRAEGLLLHAQKKQREAKHQEATRLLLEVMELLPHWAPRLTDAKFISRTLDLCQLIRDVLNVREMTLRSPASSCLGKYRALRCCMETVPPNSSEFQAVMALLQDSKLQIHQVLRVGRGVELQTFKSELGNIKPLLHSSSPSNFVGILSRGLLLPRVGVEYHGIERTDIGNLGSGIYFTDAVSTSLKYSKPSVTHGSRLLLVCDVALGSCKDVVKRDYTLTEAPNGHHSMHGVRSTPNTSSEFEDDEYVVYSPDQVKLKYVVQFTVEGDQLKEFSPAVTTSEEPQHHDQLLSLEDDGVEIVKDPLGNVTPGLLDSAGQQLPLEAVYVKCKLMDLVSQVVIFQKYTNLSSVPIEAKYVFPLDDSAAVCGFEAYINGKHVVGKVKEKWTARKEYKQAIEKGHGAYLMDQDAPDVFTISVGNLPPRATVLIKVTFVSELIVRGGSILFSLPGSVAPWQKSAALNQTTQVTLEKVYVTDEGASTREFSLDMSVEMPFEIRSLQCITHKIMIKKTACKAVVSVLPGEVMGAEGFQLSISLSEVHLPRMWVEKHTDKDSQACMLVFYPDFDISSHSDGSEVVLLLDTSESMKGESLHMAQRIALQVLKSLDHNLRINVLLFGTDHLGVFQTPKPLVNVRQTAERFIKKFHPIGGSTELWRPLRALSLLPPSRGIRNLLLLSDGHIQNAELTLQLLKDNVQHSRLFTCGLSPTANRHMLRALAQAGGGAYEFFDTKMKHNWAEKVASQVKRMSSPGCNSVSVKWQQFNPTAPTPVQAPKQLHALFNDCHTLVYGFVPHCTQATLLGNLSGQELNTMVSTSELQMTRGTFLHKLTARAIIRDYEDGSLDTSEAEHEGKKAELKSFIIELSKEFSILSQFTSFLAIEERDSEQPEEGFTDIPKLVAEENVDFLPYMSWSLPQEMEMRESPSIVTMSCLLYEEEASCSSFDPPRKVAARKAMKKSSKLIKGHDKIKHLSVGASFGQAASALHHYVKCSSKVPQADVPLMPPPPPLLHHIAAPQISLPASLITPPPPEPPCSAAPTSPSFGVLGSLNLEAVLSNASLKMSRGRARRAASSELEMTHDAPRCSLTVPQAAVPLKPSSLPRRHHLTPLQSTKVLASSMPPPPCPAEPPPPPTGSSPSLDVGVVPTNTCIKLRGRARQAALSELEISHDGEADVPLMPPPPPPIYRDGVASPMPPPPPPVYSHAMASPMPPPPPPRPAAPPPASFFQSLDSGLVPTNTSLKRKPKMLERVVFMGQSGTSKECGPSRLGGFSPAQSIVTLDLPVTSDLPMPEIQPIMHQASLEFADAAPAAALFGAASFQSEPEPTECFSNLTHLFRHKKRVKERRYEHMATTDTADILRIKPKLKWERIFHLQHSEGYWELTTELGELINVNLDLFANVFLKDKGICSLGARAHADILKLVATLLVLQLMRVEKLEEGKLLRTLFCLVSSSQPRPEHWDKVRRAVEWVGWADKQYPCIYSRLEFGLSWESSTRQLLGYEDLPPYSALSGLNLQRPAVPLLVH